MPVGDTEDGGVNVARGAGMRIAAGANVMEAGTEDEGASDPAVGGDVLVAVIAGGR